MRAWFGIRRVLTVVGLVSVWCALWGEATVANVASGLLIAVAVVASGVGTGSPGSIRIGPLLRFAGLVAIDLVSSTISVSREVLTPTDRTNEAIIAVDLPAETRRHFLLMIVAVTVTPGTAVVDADADTGRLYLHLLHAERTGATCAHVRQLADLACRALPVSRKDSAR